MVIYGQRQHGAATSAPVSVAPVSRHTGIPGRLWRSLSLRSPDPLEARGAPGLGGGAPLPADLRRRSESALGANFADVRIHTDAGAARGAREMGAAAYTLGNHIAFGAGRYRPDSPAGGRLLSHELVHVLQQRAGPDPGRFPSPPPAEDAAEREAEELAAGAGLEGRAVAGPVMERSGGRVQRQSEAAADEEERRLERASERARGRAEGNETEAMLSGAEVVYRLMRLRFPSFADSVTRVGLGEAPFFVKIEPDRPGGHLDRDEGFRITVDRRFLGKSLHLQEFWLRTALAQLPPLSGPGPGSYQGALLQAAQALKPAGFGSTTGTQGGAQDDADAYDASTWQEVGKTVIRTTVEPSRAMRRLVDSLDQPVPKAGGGTTRWRMDCFDAVVFAQVFARWKTMSRFAFNQQFHPLELGFDSRAKTSEWERGILSSSKGGDRFIPPRNEEAVTVATPSGYEVRLPPPTKVKEGWDQLLRDAPVGSQVVWKNFDAERRCNLLDRTKEPSFCESWQAENAIKVGDDRYLAFGLAPKAEGAIYDALSIQRALAETALKEVPAHERVPVEEYMRKHIGVSMLRRPK